MPKSEEHISGYPLVVAIERTPIDPQRFAARKRSGNWAHEKLIECANILRAASKELDPLDYVEDARWSIDPKVALALGYLEAWADVEDVTVAELLYEMKF